MKREVFFHYFFCYFIYLFRETRKKALETNVFRRRRRRKKPCVMSLRCEIVFNIVFISYTFIFLNDMRVRWWWFSGAVKLCKLHHKIQWAAKTIITKKKRGWGWGQYKKERKRKQNVKKLPRISTKIVCVRRA